jgi:FKBP-type peptidyl-prolyl cis-trans isomerase SlyD
LRFYKSFKIQLSLISISVLLQKFFFEIEQYKIIKMIEKNKVVSVHYRLKKDDNTGALIEETYNAQPLTFLYGVGGMIPKFEAELSGLKEKDSFSFSVPAKEAYGEFDEQAIVDLDINIFKVDGKLDDKMIRVGGMVPMKNTEGHRIDGKVAEITEDKVKMDFNHPLAGQDLYFEGEITKLRDATEEEIKHGHVHEGGHHHHEEGHECTGCGKHNH